MEEAPWLCPSSISRGLCKERYLYALFLWLFEDHSYIMSLVMLMFSVTTSWGLSNLMHNDPNMDIRERRKENRVSEGVFCIFHGFSVLFCRGIIVLVGGDYYNCGWVLRSFLGLLWFCTEPFKISIWLHCIYWLFLRKGVNKLFSRP